jgi:hypothetical protein
MGIGYLWDIGETDLPHQVCDNLSLLIFKRLTDAEGVELGVIAIANDGTSYWVLWGGTNQHPNNSATFPCVPFGRPLLPWDNWLKYHISKHHFFKDL